MMFQQTEQMMQGQQQLWPPCVKTSVVDISRSTSGTEPNTAAHVTSAAPSLAVAATSFTNRSIRFAQRNHSWPRFSAGCCLAL